jgi:dihydroflavonol-4-reductase
MKVPNFAIRLMANFDPVVKDRLFELDKHRPVSNAKAKRILGWAPRGNEEAVVAAAESMIQEGVV